MKYDTEKKGLETIYKPWQVAVWKELWKGEALTSGQVHQALVKVGATAKSEDGVSRASVINFLNNQVDEDLLAFTEFTGKGGVHRVYEPLGETSTEELLKEHLTAVFMNSVEKELA